MADRDLNKWLMGRKDKIAEEVKEGKELKGFTELPVGTYLGLYTQHECKKDKNGAYGILTELYVLEGEKAGESTVIWQSLEKDEAFKWIVPALKNSGYEVEDADELINALMKKQDDPFGLVANRHVVKFSVTETKSKTNDQKYINKRIMAFIEDYDLDDVEYEVIMEARKNRNTKKQEETSDSEPSEESGNKTTEETTEVIEISVGDTVVFKQGKKTNSGTVTELDEEAGTITVTAGGKEITVAADAIVEFTPADKTAEPEEESSEDDNETV